MALTRWLAILVVVLALLVSPAAKGADLAQIERRIDKEPAYSSKDVKYALVVFGERASTRVWLALDGDTLYADVNGNGDLTDAGERFAPVKEFSNPDEGQFYFLIPEIRDGERVHKDLSLTISKLDQLQSEPLVSSLLRKNPNARGYLLSAEIELPPFQGAGIGGRVRQHNFPFDARGVLQFAGRPADAPVLHFGGPWQISLFGPHTLTIGRSKDLVLGVGTPGIGPGTTVWVDYQGVIPENAFPVASISYLPQKAGEPPPEELYELKHRC
jgi:hypothetical protein